MKRLYQRFVGLWRSGFGGKIVVIATFLTLFSSLCCLCTLTFSPSNTERAATDKMQAITSEIEAVVLTNTPELTLITTSTSTFVAFPTGTSIPTNTSPPESITLTSTFTPVPTDTPSPTDTPTATQTMSPEMELEIYSSYSLAVSQIYYRTLESENFQQAYDELEKIHPPHNYTVFHVLYLIVLQRCIDGTDHIGLCRFNLETFPAFYGEIIKRSTKPLPLWIYKDERNRVKTFKDIWEEEQGEKLEMAVTPASANTHPLELSTSTPIRPTSTATPIPFDEFEITLDNGTEGEPDYTPIQSGVPQHHNIHAKPDEDYVYFSLSKPSSVFVEVESELPRLKESVTI